MDLAELKALPVGDIAAPDCALFMWVVGSHLEESIGLARAWGFTFKTDAFYWAKQRLIGADQIDLFTGDIAEPRMGFGYWTRKQVEPCWLFTRGAPKRVSKGIRQLIVEPRREHSRKPDAQYDRIEALVGGPRLELFARRARPGWDCWGNETDKFAEVA
jgi:N6-adenosine-specific RNA methylase IME4